MLIDYYRVVNHDSYAHGESCSLVFVVFYVYGTLKQLKSFLFTFLSEGMKLDM